MQDKNLSVLEIAERSGIKDQAVLDQIERTELFVEGFDALLSGIARRIHAMTRFFSVKVLHHAN